jgi:hypothetical protein
MPSILIKTADELARQRHAGELLASVFTMLDAFIKPGVTTMEINDRAEAFIVDQLHARPASKGQYDFPYVLNTSVNEVVCHGIPKSSEHLKSGAIAPASRELLHQRRKIAHDSMLWVRANGKTAFAIAAKGSHIHGDIQRRHFTA